MKLRSSVKETIGYVADYIYSALLCRDSNWGSDCYRAISIRGNNNHNLSNNVNDPTFMS